VRLGSTTDEITGGGGTGGLQMESSLSYLGHFGFLHAQWTPRKPLALTLDARAGRKLYTDAVTRGGGQGSGPGSGQSRSVARSDTLISVDLGSTWDFYKGLSLEATLGWERSISNLAGRLITGSYSTYTGSLGLSWTFL
jgi:hypothetical protein